MHITVPTKGHYDFVDLTEQVGEFVRSSGVREGMVTVFVSGSTAAVTTMENESGLMKDLVALFETWAPEDAEYAHHARWGDHNGAAHMKAAIIGPSVAVPVEDGRPVLGTWQHVMLVDFDERPRSREVVMTVASP